MKVRNTVPNSVSHTAGGNQKKAWLRPTKSKKKNGKLMRGGSPVSQGSGRRHGSFSGKGEMKKAIARMGDHHGTKYWRAVHQGNG